MQWVIFFMKGEGRGIIFVPELYPVVKTIFFIRAETRITILKLL